MGQPRWCKLHLKKKRRSIQPTGDRRCWTPSSLRCRTSAGICCPRCPRWARRVSDRGRALGTKLSLLGAKLRASPNPLSLEGLEGPVLPCQATGNHSRLTPTSKDSSIPLAALGLSCLLLTHLLGVGGTSLTRGGTQTTCTWEHWVLRHFFYWLI